MTAALVFFSDDVDQAVSRGLQRSLSIIVYSSFYACICNSTINLSRRATNDIGTGNSFLQKRESLSTGERSLLKGLQRPWRLASPEASVLELVQEVDLSSPAGT